jgi:hypothetical protein
MLVVHWLLERRRHALISHGVESANRSLVADDPARTLQRDFTKRRASRDAMPGGGSSATWRDVSVNFRISSRSAESPGGRGLVYRIYLVNFDS